MCRGQVEKQEAEVMDEEALEAGSDWTSDGGEGGARRGRDEKGTRDE